MGPEHGITKYTHANHRDNPKTKPPKERDICGTCKKSMDVCTCAKDGAGAKFDSDKLRWDLLPFKEVEDIVQVLTDGAKKYAPNNWQKVPDKEERYFAALLRHVIARRKGEIIDPDSGRTHLSHAGCCLLFLMWADNQNIKD